MKRMQQHWLRGRLRGLVAGFAFLIVAMQACEPTTPAFDEGAKAKVVAEVTTFLHDYHAAVCKGGLLREFEFPDSSADFYWKPPGADAVLSYDTVAAMVRRNALVIDTTCVEWMALSVMATAADSAHYKGRLQAWTATSEGDTFVEDFEEVGNLIKRQGRWWLLNGETKPKH